jgi:FHA domain/Trypsin-like peptidase domain
VKIKVVHTFGRHAGVVTPLEQGVVRFGRSPDNDVIFDPDYDRDASGHHAEARFEAGRWVLVDLKSRNGTFLRGQRVDRAPLASGDEVMFGLKGPRIRLEIEAAAPAPQPQPQPAPLAKGGTSAMAAFSAPAPPPPARNPFPSGPAAMPAPAYGMPPVVEAPAAGKRVGQRTIAMMISSAVATARGRSPQHSTQEINAYVDRRVDAATAGQKRTTYFLGLLLLVALAGLGGLIVWSTRSSDDIDKLRGDLAKLPPDDPRRKEIEGRLGTLHPSNANFGRNLYDSSKKGIFMLAAGGEGFCTAFAVRPSVLATNAHCVLAAKRHGGSIVALENEGRGAVSFPVSDMKAHPGYRDTDANALTPDVGIVTISGKAAIVLNLATAAELGGTGAGDDIYLIGFPGRLMDASNPAATFLAAHIGRITNAGGRPGAYAEDWLIQHDAPTTHGTSGSPIFNGRGKVIAINAGGYLEGDDETIAGRKTEVVKDSPYKFGMRIDLLDAILK